MLSGREQVFTVESVPLLILRLQRILGEVTPERVAIVRHADHIYISMIREWNLYDKISQAYAALDTSRAVGVMVGHHHQGFSRTDALLITNATIPSGR